jgi:serine phosphatase RsbU (regulator of sigma subunit)
LENFVRIFRLIRPRSLELRAGEVEIYGDTVFLNGVAGGDHLVYIDFERRYDLDRRTQIARDPVVKRELEENRRRTGILVADVSGHRASDALVVAMLHQAFLTGVLYELDRYGQVTTRLFENLNTRFYNSLSIEKYVTLVYGEVSHTGSFRFLSAASPDPLIFSAEYDRFVTISPDRLVGFYPLGVFPSEDDVDVARNLGAFRYKPKYTVNEVNLMSPGDILLLMTDGLADHERSDDQPFVPLRLEAALRSVKHRSARSIFDHIRDQARAFAPLQDDLTLVVVKRTGTGGGR